jgi:hypothetical protein
MHEQEMAQLLATSLDVLKYFLAVKFLYTNVRILL